MDKSQPLLLFVITNISFAVYNIFTVYSIQLRRTVLFMCSSSSNKLPVFYVLPCIRSCAVYRLVIDREAVFRECNLVSSAKSVCLMLFFLLLYHCIWCKLPLNTCDTSMIKSLMVQ